MGITTPSCTADILFEQSEGVILCTAFQTLGAMRRQVVTLSHLNTSWILGCCDGQSGPGINLADLRAVLIQNPPPPSTGLLHSLLQMTIHEAGADYGDSPPTPGPIPDTLNWGLSCRWSLEDGCLLSVPVPGEFLPSQIQGF